MTGRGRRLSTSRWIWGVLVLVAGAGPARAQGQNALGREVRSLFADRCFVCHGPGLKKPKAGLRLDDPASLFASRDGGRFTVKPGSLADSELWRRVVASDDGERMPPPDSHLALAATEVALLRRWIVGGGPDPRPPGVETL
jgi:mono/diheme cytochrome c family protein